MPTELLQVQSFPKEWNARGARTATSLTLAAMSLGYGVVQLDVTIVNTALDAMGRTLGGGVAELQWVVSAYTVVFAAFILTAGALGDGSGATLIVMASSAIFTAASLAFALSPDAIVLITQAAKRSPQVTSASGCSSTPGCVTIQITAGRRSGPGKGARVL